MRRLSLAILSIVMALAAVPALSTSPADAACGTAWTSKKDAPKEIRVLRTAKDTVATVDFKRYVAVVMASGEWPTSLPRALLEAGAHAVKQYGWYYALKGNHRDSYITPAGACYDVRDDSRDQVFRPESAEPTQKQKDARDDLWGLSLRKRGDFLLTGYRQGSATKCAADADGFHLYARSAKDCAKRLEYDGERILRAYYQPGLDFIWAPGTEPDRAEPEPEASPSESTDPDASPAEAIDPGEGAADAQGLVGRISDWYEDLITNLTISEP